MLTTSEIKALRDDLRKAHELVSAALETANAARISRLSRYLRDIGKLLDDATYDNRVVNWQTLEMQAQLERETPPKTGGSND